MHFRFGIEMGQEEERGGGKQHLHDLLSAVQLPCQAAAASGGHCWQYSPTRVKPDGCHCRSRAARNGSVATALLQPDNTPCTANTSH